MKQIESNNVDVSDITIDNYWHYLDLQFDPFDESSNAKPYTQYSVWKENLDLIVHLNRYSNILIAVTGGEDIGKTTFLKQLYRQVQNNVYTCQIYAETNLSINKFLKIMCEYFDLSTQISDSDTLVEKINHILSSMQATGQQFCLLIDDAHQLSNELLRLLLTIVTTQNESDCHLHCILFGGVGLEVRLSALVKATKLQNSYHHVELTPLNFQQTIDYLKLRFKAAGAKSEFLMNEEELNQLYKFASGHPGRVNRVARQILVESVKKALTPPEPKQTKTLANKSRIIGTAVLGVVMLGLIYFVALPQRGVLPSQSAPQFVSTEPLQSPFLLVEKLATLKTPSVIFDYYVPGIEVLSGIKNLITQQVTDVTKVKVSVEADKKASKTMSVFDWLYNNSLDV